jgi:diaminopimelate decarboxylase
MDRAFDFIDHQICFAVKSNSNIAVLNVLAKLGAGFDIVTGGELHVFLQQVVTFKNCIFWFR